MHYIIGCIGTDNQTKPLIENLPQGDKEGEEDREEEDSQEEGSKERGEEEREEEEEEGVAPLTGLINEVEKWRAAFSHIIDTSDTLVTSQVSVCPYPS